MLFTGSCTERVRVRVGEIPGRQELIQASAGQGVGCAPFLPPTGSPHPTTPTQALQAPLVH
jgi:hypothetical protein